MLLFVILGLLFVSGFLLTHKHSFEGNWQEFVGLVITVISGTLLVAACVILPLQHMEVHAKIAEIEAIEATATAARTADNDIEGAAFRLKIAEANEWIASAQYWNSTIFDPFWPDKIDSLQPIR